MQGGAALGALGRQAGFVQHLAEEMPAKLHRVVPFFAVTMGGGICSSYYSIFLIISWLHACSCSQAFLWFSHKVPSVDTSTPVETEEARQKVPDVL